MLQKACLPYTQKMDILSNTAISGGLAVAANESKKEIRCWPPFLERKEYTWEICCHKTSKTIPIFNIS